MERVIDRRGRTPNATESVESGIPILTSSNVKMGRLVVPPGTTRVSEGFYEQWMGGERCRRGDILITSAAPPGRVAQVPDDGPYGLGRRVLLLGIDPGVASNDFLVHQLAAEPFQRVLRANVTGTASQGITRSRLLNLPVLLPPRREQEEITAVLASVDDSIEAATRVVEQTHRVREGLLENLLGRASGDTARLGDVLPEGAIRNGIRHVGTEVVDGTPIVRAGDLGDGESLDPSGLKRVVVGESEAKRFSLDANDVLVCRVNSLRLLGGVGVVGEADEPIVFDSNVMRFRLDPDRGLLPRYLALVLASPAVRHLLRSRAKRAVAQASIDHSDIRELHIPVPTLEEQDRIVRAISAVDATRRRDFATIEQAMRLKAGLVNGLFTGTIRVTA